MRFKPMPQYHVGALVREGDARTSPVGKMFIQPKVTLESGEVTLLDNVIGPNFAVIGWGCNPLWGMSESQIQQWQALGTRFIRSCRIRRYIPIRITTTALPALVIRKTACARGLPSITPRWW